MGASRLLSREPSVLSSPPCWAWGQTALLPDHRSQGSVSFLSGVGGASSTVPGLWGLTETLLAVFTHHGKGCFSGQT